MPYQKHTQLAVELFRKHASFAASGIVTAASEFGVRWQNDFESALDHLYFSPEALETAIKGYRGFAVDSMRRQKRFEREGSYPHKTYEQASQEVYLNSRYMTEEYLPGLLLSHFLWGHHYRQIEYFRTFVTPRLVRQKAAEFAEVGVGTGIYSRIALEEAPEAVGAGYEISPLSIAFAKSHLDAYGLGDRYALELRDILAAPAPKRFQWVFCVEVLEHLEDPVALLRGLKALAEPGGKLFVTAALNAAHADHIYLYRNVQDVLDHVAQAGLHVDHFFCANAYQATKPDVPVPAALAMVLTAPR